MVNILLAYRYLFKTTCSITYLKMKISDTEIKKFQTIFKKKYGCEIKEEEAMISARALLNFINAGLSFNKTKDADK